jgi:hypothetical protein
VSVETKEIYGSRTASHSGNGNGDKVGDSLQSVFELALQNHGPEHTAKISRNIPATGVWKIASKV